jgi:hypothetical protein
MAFRYTLRLADGNDAGEVELAYQPEPGDTIRLEGNKPALVRAVVPHARISEFVDRPLYGAIVVELV